MPYHQKYAKYYDILYQKKDYAGECDFLERIFKKYSKKTVSSILDLGCGTGKHDFILAERGYKVTGIDLSSSMIHIAKGKNKDKKGGIKFINGDIRNFHLNENFDVAVALFGVFCYLATNKDLISTLRVARKHIKKGGLLIFDCWFGPAVLVQKPRTELKVFKINDEKIIKSVRPNLDVLNQVVDLEYKLTKSFRKKTLEKVTESHKVRFFFPQEIKCLLEKEEFQFLEMCPFKRINKKPGIGDWSITVIARKI